MNKNIFNKILQHYVKDRIYGHIENLYVYYQSSTDNGTFSEHGFIYANNEKEAYIKLFNKFASWHMRCLCVLRQRNDHNLDLTLINKKINEKIHEIKFDGIEEIINSQKPCYGSSIQYRESFLKWITSLAYSDCEEEQNELDNIKYNYMKMLSICNDPFPRSCIICIRNYFDLVKTELPQQNIIEKISEKYIHEKIGEIKKKFYICYHVSRIYDNRKNTEIVAANNKKDAYIQFFDKFAFEHIRCLLFLCLNEYKYKYGYKLINSHIIKKKFNEIDCDKIKNLIMYIIRDVPTKFIYSKIPTDFREIIMSFNFSDDQHQLDNLKYDYMKRYTKNQLTVNHNIHPHVYIEKLKPFI